MPEKFARFWRELKRRNVVRVVTVYAASAFVVLELVDIITGPFGLPDWTLKFVVVILVVGLLVALVLSWLYDIHPEGGFIRTEPEHAAGGGEGSKSSSRWKMATYISFVVIAGLIVVNLLPRSGKKVILEKSIAVLPFRNDSPDQENAYFINGTMESILNNLSSIKDLRTISRSSVEKYRETGAYIPDVAKELMVSYVLEGSMQKYGNRFRLTLQLIDRNDNHVWAEQYDREIVRIEDYLSLQSEIAGLVAGELQAIITPEEHELLEKVPTTNLSAYDLYLLGNQYNSYGATEKDLLKAIELYETAVTIDPAFALPYEGMGLAYRNLVWYAHWLPDEAFKRAREAVLKALEIDDRLAGAHELLGIIHYEYDWDLKASEFELNRAIELNPNKASAYRSLFDLNLASGRFDMAHQFIRRAVSLDPNNLYYQLDLGRSYFVIGEVDSAIQYLGERGPNHYLAQVYLETGQNEKAIEVFTSMERTGAAEATYFTWLGIAYFRAGMKEKTIEMLELVDSLETENTSMAFFRGALLAELGEPDSALFWLERTYEERNQILFYYKAFQIPYTSLRSDPRFIEMAKRLPTLD